MSSLWSQENKSLSCQHHQDYGIIECPQEIKHAQMHCYLSCCPLNCFWHQKKQTKAYPEKNLFKWHRAYAMSFSGSKGFWTLPFTLGSRFCVCLSDQILVETWHWIIIMFVPGVCYGDTGSEVETEGNGMLQCRVGSLFTGRNSFHPGEPREGIAGLPTGWSHLHTNCY